MTSKPISKSWTDYGLAGLRRHRILRLTKEAYDQDALLSYEDLAVLLTSSPATMKRDIQHLKRDGYFVMTRGTKLDMGPGTVSQDADPRFVFQGLHLHRDRAEDEPL